MFKWTGVQHTSRSPLCDAPRLSAEVVARDRLTPSDRREMYGLLDTYFENTSPARFEQDLGEKELVILLRDPEKARMAGFSTMMKLRVDVEGRPVVGFFSGDTIIARDYWGSSALGRQWLQTVFQEADRIERESPDTLLYWFLICSGYKTWRYLPVFFRRYSPNPECHAAGFDEQVLHALAKQKFGKEYDPGSGIVRFRRANPLRPGVAEVSESRLRDRMVEFFVRMNPGHARGDELACIAPIGRWNLTRAGLRLLDAGGGT